jgi:hypothetical protein
MDIRIVYGKECMEPRTVKREDHRPALVKGN